ncbi:hypothetical protein JRO89_XS10G0102900 [Xanthoceras sorbifolium]|uniref:ARM repeat superfamily protein n=1 Tax=Xanthoceras sorbifolium TaxID=99658 RepID=A0ABQ8HI99_9ROSI|nr:hypothetical protein JRO89_XS10G0102900 [Xanthoceras sorbifolium]
MFGSGPNQEIRKIRKKSICHRRQEMAESSSSSSSTTDAEKEELLDRMLTRLALCDDSKLQALISKLLPLTISFLSSQSTSLRNKASSPFYFFFSLVSFSWQVLEILSHVNKRVKHQPEICLPLAELWKMYTVPNAAPMVKNFCIVYIEMAFERAQLKEKEAMAPMLVENISKLSQQHQEIILRIAARVYALASHGGFGSRSLREYDQPLWITSAAVWFNMIDCEGFWFLQAVQVRELHPTGCIIRHAFMRSKEQIIGECHASGIDDEVVVKYQLISDLRDKDLFVEFCLHTILYQVPSQGGGSPSGLSIAQANRVTGKHPLKHDVILRIKLGILNVIDVMKLDAELVYPLYLAASVDCQEPVVKRGEELMKKKASGANLDDPILINRLFLLFNGTSTTANVAPESKVNPGNAALKAKLMSIFCRSITAANNFPATLQCIFGCMYGSGTTLRLKQLGMEFTVWVFKHAKFDQLKLMGPVILNGILKLLDGYLYSESDAIARETKTFSYQAIGLLAQRLPQLFRDKTEIVVRLFDALKAEAPSLRLVVQEATNSLAAAYMMENIVLAPLDDGAPATILMDLEKLLLNNMQADQSEVRFCAVRWATSLFDLQHCPSRFICMLGAADSRLDIREIALEGLFPVKDEGRTNSQNVDLKYPKLGSMLEYINKQQPKLVDSTEMTERKLLFPSQMYMAMIKFLLKCFEYEFEQNNSLGRSSEFLSSVETMCLLLEHAMAIEGSVELHATASKALIIIGSHLPEMIASHYALKVSWLKQLLSHVDLDTRESVARLLGIASSSLSFAACSALIDELVSAISGTQKLRFEAHHGALCAIGFVTADCMSRTPVIPETLFQNTLKCLINVVNSETATLASVSMQALGHIGLRVPLPPLANDSDSVDILEALHEKLKKLLSGGDNKAIQKIVVSLGHMCAKETSSSHLNIALNLIFSLCRCKVAHTSNIFSFGVGQVEDILFAAGEALSFLWGGVPVTADVILKTNYTSLSMTSNFLMGDTALSWSKNNSDWKSEASADDHIMVRDVITRKLFDDLLYSSRKEERCAGTVWLLSLTMYCGHHPTIQQMLSEIQVCY